jgi:hypothetical protein
VAVEGGGGGGGGRVRCTSTESGSPGLVIHWRGRELDIFLCAVQLSGEFQVKKKNKKETHMAEGRGTVTSAGQNKMDTREKESASFQMFCQKSTLDKPFTRKEHPHSK